MSPRLLSAFAVAILLAGLAGAAIWSRHPRPEPEQPALPDLPPGTTAQDAGVTLPPAAGPETGSTTDGATGGATEEAGMAGAAGALPVPPFPPRIADDGQYDKCMTMLADDPEGAEAIATSWQASGGGDAATHCQALAKIAGGDPEAGAAMLESLAHAGKAEGLTRVVLLSQAAEARQMADQPGPALKDDNEALAITPDDADLLIDRADANDDLGREAEAIGDLDRALAIDGRRGDALVLRAAVFRRMERLADARDDIDKAIALDPDDAEALVERGILRQRMGDPAGARQDWTHARDVDPTSEAAELAAQNLALLDAGPDKK